MEMMTTNGTHVNASNLTTGPVFTTPVYLLAWVTLANVLVFVTGIVGNTLVILVVTLVRDMKTATNLCLMNLSIADLLVLLICQPSALIEFYAQEVWMLGQFMLLSANTHRVSNTRPLDGTNLLCLGNGDV